jgi:hydrogenase/urease accessory protein HupE
MKKIAATSLGLLSISATSAMAHPGNHAFSVAASLFHLLTEPDHLAMMAVTAAIGYGLWRWRKLRA